ncbi:MAG: hypothetical protein WBL40_03355 [Terrimicrobiaceae bacterium]
MQSEAELALAEKLIPHLADNRSPTIRREDLRGTFVEISAQHGASSLRESSRSRELALLGEEYVVGKGT